MSAMRISDMVLAFLLLLLCLPVLSLACLIVSCELQSSPLMRRDRVTRDGRIVRVFQLRTTGGARKLSSSAVNVIRKVYIDQIPQLINVVLGDFSLVGCGRDNIGDRGLLAWLER